MLGSKDLADKKAGLGSRVVWFKEAPVAGPLTAGSLDPSAPKQAEFGHPCTLHMKKSAWGKIAWGKKKASSWKHT